MVILKGTGVSEGIAFGRIFINKPKNSKSEKIEIKDANEEINRYKKAKKATLDYTKRLYDQVLKELGENEAEIFKAHEMMINDPDFENSIIGIITQEMANAEYAILKTSEIFSKIFLDMPDPYMKSRAMDVADISNCMINELSGKNSGESFGGLKGNVILAAEDFTPSEITSANKEKVAGFLCSEGSAYSHSSILLRVMKIPGIVCVKGLEESYSGKEAIFDGSSGEVYIEPERPVVDFFKNKKLFEERSEKLLEKLKGKASVTLDGKKIKLCANMNNPDEIGAIAESDCDGIGLLRSEFIYLSAKELPTEEKQFEIYKNVLEKLKGKEVIIRTLDIGSDKKADYLNLPFEHNPAMGYRGIRICLDRPDIFKTQLRAIYRASAYGNVSIMFPMITSLDEIKEIKKYIKEVKEELKNEGKKIYENVKIGVMIETPAAVMISDELAKEVDFFSIGTNDLTQYTLAVDRQNGKVSKMFDTHNKSVLRMIKKVTENAHKNGITVGICGESAADESLIETYLAIGIDELSMSAPFLLKVKKKILEIKISNIKNKVLNSI